jgi:hypothetical protein
MSLLEFEPTITASEREKAVHALDHSATLTGPPQETKHNNPAPIIEKIIDKLPKFSRQFLIKIKLIKRIY